MSQLGTLPLLEIQSMRDAKGDHACGTAPSKRNIDSVTQSPTFAEINESIEKRQRLTSPGWDVEESSVCASERGLDELDPSFLSHLITSSDFPASSPIVSPTIHSTADTRPKGNEEGNAAVTTTTTTPSTPEHKRRGRTDEECVPFDRQRVESERNFVVASCSLEKHALPSSLSSATEGYGPRARGGENNSFFVPSVIPASLSSDFITTVPPPFLNSSCESEVCGESFEVVVDKQFVEPFSSPQKCDEHLDAETDSTHAQQHCDVKFETPKKWSRWSEDEDRLLRRAVKIEGENWRKISNFHFNGTRKHIQCKNRWRKVLQPGLQRGKWTKEEDDIIIKCKSNGISKWSDISSRLPGRIAEQVKERWLNAVNPDLKKGSWSAEEIRTLEAAQEKYGNRWSKIATLLPGRSENSVKNRWYNSRTSAQRARRSGSRVVSQNELFYQEAIAGIEQTS